MSTLYKFDATEAGVARKTRDGESETVTPQQGSEADAVSGYAYVMSVAFSLVVFAIAWLIDSSHPGVMTRVNWFYALCAVALVAWSVSSAVKLGKEVSQRQILVASLAPDLVVLISLFVLYFPVF